MKPRIVAILQARMASSRLPGKVLMDLEGLPVLGRAVERTRRAKSIEMVVVATTTESADDRIAEYCKSSRIALVRGSHFDVLDRYHTSAEEVNAEIVVRITADCPLIDPSLIDDAVGALLGATESEGKETARASTRFEFVANRLPPPWKRTYPIGLDTEVCTFEALERAWREARSGVEREHVMPYLYEGVVLSRESRRISTGISPRGFRVAVLDHTEDLGSHRWTIDTAEDLIFVREIYRRLGGRSEFSWLDVLGLLAAQPELLAINAAVEHKTLNDIDERAPGGRAG